MQGQITSWCNSAEVSRECSLYALNQCIFQDLFLIILELRTEDFAESKEADHPHLNCFHLTSATHLLCTLCSPIRWDMRTIFMIERSPGLVCSSYLSIYTETGALVCKSDRSSSNK